LDARVSASPAVSSASTVFAKVGAAASAAMAATSASWAGERAREGRQEMLRRDLGEGRNAEGPGPVVEQGVGAGGLGGGGLAVLIHEAHMGVEFLHCTVGSLPAFEPSARHPGMKRSRVRKSLNVLSGTSKLVPSRRCGLAPIQLASEIDS